MQIAFGGCLSSDSLLLISYCALKFIKGKNCEQSKIFI